MGRRSPFKVEIGRNGRNEWRGRQGSPQSGLRRADKWDEAIVTSNQEVALSGICRVARNCRVEGIPRWDGSLPIC